jgi:hypothetical protein
MDPSASTIPRGDEAPASIDELASTRLAIVAGASAGVLGRSWFSGADLGLRYRPVELDFHVVDFHRTTQPQRVGVGGDLLGRMRLPHGSLDALVGASATAAAQNGAINPKFGGIFAGFAGLGAQARTKLFGVAQPYVSVRAGIERGDVAGDGTKRIAPMIELHFGLSSPER